MSDFKIPHIAPVRFVKSLNSADFNSASVNIGFDYIPSLPMLIEAATQSSSGVLYEETVTDCMGFLVTVRNVKLLQELKSKEFIVNVTLDNKLANFKYFSFIILENDESIATGSFSISLQ